MGIFIGLYMIICVLLVVFVLLQKGDSGLGSIGGSANTVLGSARGTVMSKVTYILATVFFVGAIGLSVLSSGTKSVVDKLDNKKVKNKTDIQTKKTQTNQAPTETVQKKPLKKK